MYPLLKCKRQNNYILHKPWTPTSDSSHTPPFHYQFIRNTEVKSVPDLFSVLCEPFNGHKNFTHLRNAVP